MVSVKYTVNLQGQHVKFAFCCLTYSGCCRHLVMFPCCGMKSLHIFMIRMYVHDPAFCLLYILILDAQNVNVTPSKIVPVQLALAIIQIA